MSTPYDLDDPRARHPDDIFEGQPTRDDRTPEVAEPPERAAARKRVLAKRKLRGDLVAYVVVNLFLIGVWAFTGQGYFWPAWVLAGWGVGLALQAWDAYFRAPVTEHDVDRELDRYR